MSYILDALNKSDQEQKRQAAQDLHSLHGPVDISPPSKRGQWISILGILLAINGTFFYWFSQRDAAEPATHLAGVGESDIRQNEFSRTQEKAGDKNDIDQSTKATRGALTSNSKPVFGEDVQVLITPQDLARGYSGAGTSQTATPVASPALSAVSVAELPINVQRKIPDMKFSSHIYADDPTLRMVNINGKFLRVGDTIVDDVKLVGITEDGVILTYLHYTFEMSVIRDWSFN